MIEREDYLFKQIEELKTAHVDADVLGTWNKLKEENVSYNLEHYEEYKKPIEDFTKNDWKQFVKIDLPLTNEEGHTIRIFSQEGFIRLISSNETLKKICTEALKKRIKEKNPVFLPIGVAFSAFLREEEREEDILRTEHDCEQLLTTRIINDSKNLRKFSFVLENYTRSETYPERYSTIARYLTKRGIGLLQNKKFLDIGSCSGEALLPLTRLPQLQIFALDKIPEDLNPIKLSKEEAKRGLKIKRIQGDALNIPFQKESIDIVNLSYLLTYLNESDCQKVLQKAKEVLKDDGIMFIQPLEPDPDAETPDETYTITAVIRKNKGKLRIVDYLKEKF